MDNITTSTNYSSLRIRTNYPKNLVEIYLCNNKDIQAFCIELSLKYCTLLSDFMIRNIEESGYEDTIWFDTEKQLVEAGLLKKARIYFKIVHSEGSDLIDFGVSVQFTYKTNIIEAFCFEKHNISNDEIYEFVRLITPEYIKNTKSKTLEYKTTNDIVFNSDGPFYKLWLRSSS